MSDGWLAAAGTFAGGLITALSAAVAYLWKTRHQIDLARDKAEAAKEKTTSARQDAIIERLERQIARQDGHITDLQKSVNRLHAAHAGCEARLAELWSWISLFHRHAVHLDRIARDAGEDPGELPGLPDRPRVESARERADFEKNTAEHNTSLVKEIDSRILPPRRDAT